MFLYSILASIAGLLTRIPFVGRLLTAIIFLALDTVATFGDFSLLIGLPGWIPALVGIALIVYLFRTVRSRKKNDKNEVSWSANMKE